jgi:8-oxo-dGTP pyrophosphatase MutT (NUDIX family)
MNEKNEAKDGNRVNIIQAVETPLGFFVLVVLVVEVILGVTANFSEGNDRTYLIVGMLILIFILVLVVSLLSFFRPEALVGKRPVKLNTVDIKDTQGDRQIDLFDKESYGTKMTGLHKTYNTLGEASKEIVAECMKANVIKIMSNKGLVFLGTDDSLISTAELPAYNNLRKIQMILLDPRSNWISKGFIVKRKHQSLYEYIKEMEASHSVVESGMVKFMAKVPSSKSGVRYFSGEPLWRLVMTDKTVFVSNYAEDNTQSRNLTVCQYDNVEGSYYSAFKRHFENIWHNYSLPSESARKIIDYSTSAGGIVYADMSQDTYILLVQRHDGFWILPKGHKKFEDTSLEKAALREVTEEGGISSEYLSVEEKLDSYTDTKYETKVVHIFAIRYLGKELPHLVTDTDHAKAEWYKISDPLPVLLYQSQEHILQEFVQSRRQMKSRKPKPRSRN